MPRYCVVSLSSWVLSSLYLIGEEGKSKKATSEPTRKEGEETCPSMEKTEPAGGEQLEAAMEGEGNKAEETTAVSGGECEQATVDKKEDQEHGQEEGTVDTGGQSVCGG